MTSDIEIARSIPLKPITEIAEKLSIPQDALHPYGKHIAKVSQDFLDEKPLNPKSKMILVTAISPTSAGEGKTTTTVGLGDALAALGKKTAIALREPSLGPCFGVKGGAAGGGYAQIVPMESINLHFTGDFHAITSAHNLLSAMLDNQFYWGNPARIDSRRITWRRAMDMNDRSLRQIVSSLGGASNGFPREDGFDITVASEVMAVFCLATSLTDLQERLAQMVVGTRMGSKGREFVTASEIKAPPAMTVLLKDAFQPNLVQSLAGTPAFVHGGPFANIAHGCNSVQATTAALKLADYVVTEAGFGADLGAEKFLNIKCRKTGLRPAAAVVVATVRALKMHGGVAEADLKQENLPALQAGFANLVRHVENVRSFGVPVVVGINRFTTDTQAELDCLQQACRDTLGTDAVICTHWADGAKGAQELAAKVAALADANDKPTLDFTYHDDQPLLDKMNAIACKIYRADGIEPDAKVKEQAAILETAGFGHLPVCMAKTQSSFSANPQLRGAPSGFTIPIRSLRLSAGAGFVVAICGDIMTMPGLPRSPVAERIHLNAQGQIEGLN